MLKSALAGAIVSATAIPMPILDVNFNVNTGTLPAVLTAKGFSYTCNSVRYYWDGSLFQSLAVNTFHTSLNPVDGKWEYFPEAALTCTTKFSTDFSDVLWVKSAGITRANATSCFSGQTASKLTAAATSDNIVQIGSTSTNAIQVSAVYIEQGTATKSKVEVYDGTGLVVIANAEITWASGAVASSVGSNFSMLYTGTGPNGGKLYRLEAIVSNATSGIIRSIRIYPDTGSGGGYCYLHHATCIASNIAQTMSPIVTGASNVTRGMNILSSTTAISLMPSLRIANGVSFVANAIFPFHMALSRVVAQVTGSTANDRSSIFWGSTNLFSALSGTAASTTIASSNVATGNSAIVAAGSARASTSITAEGGKFSGYKASSSAMPTVTNMTIGHSGANTLVMHGGIRRLRVYNFLNFQQLARISMS